MGEKSILTHIPKSIFKNVPLFLILLYRPMEAEVFGKGVNRGGSQRLEIPAQYRFTGPTKAIDWLIKKQETIEKELECNIC